MMYDTKAPEELKSLQNWFGKAICQKMCDNFEALGAEEHIVSTDELGAHERMELYNHSYWFRLIDALHEEFGTLVRLFGEDDFNSHFAIEYLASCPPRHWSLNVLGDRFVDWVKENYHEQDKELVLTSSLLDWAYQRLFVAKRQFPIVVKNPQELLVTKVALQHTVELFTLPADFLKWRKELLKHPPEHWKKNPFPELVKDKTHYFILFRTPSLTIEWEEVSKEEHLLLQLISEQGTIEKALEALEEREDIDQARVETNFITWIQSWLNAGWLYKT